MAHSGEASLLCLAFLLARYKALPSVSRKILLSDPE